MKRPALGADGATDNLPSPPRMTAPALSPRSLRQPRPTGEQRRRIGTADRRRFVRLAEDVLDRRDRNRRGGDVRPDGLGPLGRNDLNVSDPTGIAAVRRMTGDHPHDPVAKRLAEDERDLARLAARMGATTPIVSRHMHDEPGARFAQ